MSPSTTSIPVPTPLLALATSFYNAHLVTPSPWTTYPTIPTDCAPWPTYERRHECYLPSTIVVQPSVTARPIAWGEVEQMKPVCEKCLYETDFDEEGCWTALPFCRGLEINPVGRRNVAAYSPEDDQALKYIEHCLATQEEPVLCDELLMLNLTMPERVIHSLAGYNSCLDRHAKFFCDQVAEAFAEERKLANGRRNDGAPTATEADDAAASASNLLSSCLKKESPPFCEELTRMSAASPGSATHSMSAYNDCLARHSAPFCDEVVKALVEERNPQPTKTRRTRRQESWKTLTSPPSGPEPTLRDGPVKSMISTFMVSYCADHPQVCARYLGTDAEMAATSIPGGYPTPTTLTKIARKASTLPALSQVEQVFFSQCRQWLTTSSPACEDIARSEASTVRSEGNWDGCVQRRGKEFCDMVVRALGWEHIPTKAEDLPTPTSRADAASATCAASLSECMREGKHDERACRMLAGIDRKVYLDQVKYEHSRCHRVGWDMECVDEEGNTYIL